MQTLCRPPRGKPLNLFILAFCGLLGLQSLPCAPSSWLLGLHTGFLALAGPRFRAFGSGAWFLSWGFWPVRARSLRVPVTSGSLPLGNWGASNEEGGIYGLALNPKRWVACLPYGRVGGEVKMLAQILGQRIQN